MGATGAFVTADRHTWASTAGEGTFPARAGKLPLILQEDGPHFRLGAIVALPAKPHPTVPAGPALWSSLPLEATERPDREVS
jgi:hypothetical protein